MSKIDKWRNFRESMLFRNMNVSNRDAMKKLKILSLGVFGKIRIRDWYYSL